MLFVYYQIIVKELLLWLKIDVHSHIGSFGGWAGVSIDAEGLIRQIDEYEIEFKIFLKIK